MAVPLRQWCLLYFIVAASAAGPDVLSKSDTPNNQRAHYGSLWTYDAAGDDWTGTDSTGGPWVCTTGKQQSPVNLLPLTATTAAVSSDHRALYELGSMASNGSNIRITNNGHSVQVSWPASGFTPKMTIRVRDGQPVSSSVSLAQGEQAQQVLATPQQFHFHAHSEHLLQGHLYPLEAHLVSLVDQASLPGCPAQGCLVVTAVLYELSDDLTTGNNWLEPLFQAMPLSEGAVSFLAPGVTLDLQQLLPSNQSYISYAGSLTTPPCTEGVLWMVMLNTQKVSLQQWRRFMTAVGDYNCTTQPPRPGDSSSSAGGSAAAPSRDQGGRRLQGVQWEQQLLAAGRPQGAERALRQTGTAEQQYSCHKLGAGANFRLPQPLNGRVLRVWRDVSSKKGYLPEDAASAASAGAVAGIVVGTTLGAGLTVLIGWVAYKEYQKRRLKRFYKYGVSNGDMLSVQREVETQWLTSKHGAIAAARNTPL